MYRSRLATSAGVIIALAAAGCGRSSRMAGPDGGSAGTGAAAGADAPSEPGGASDLSGRETAADTVSPIRDAPKEPSGPVPCIMGNVSSCTFDLPACDENGFCVGCTSAFYCRDARPVCDLAAKACVECLVHGDCHEPTRPICDTATKTCHGCASAAACVARSAATPYCDAATGACSGCAHACAAATPICDGAGCRACRRDAECAALPGPGVCLDEVGRCATDAEVSYVQMRASCPNFEDLTAGKGTSADPFCAPQAAVAALTTTRRVIVLRGPEDINLGGLDLSFKGAPVLVVGQGKAVLTGTLQFGGPSVLIHDGDVTLRGFTMTVGVSVAVAAMGGVLHMNRMRIVDYQGEAIHTDNAGFDIVNTLIARNNQGVHLGVHPTGSPHRFAFNTSAENRNIGVQCDDAQDVVSASIVVDSLAAFEIFGCMRDAASPASAPQFDETRAYHLSAASPCVDLATGLADVPIEDVDGDLRPQGAAADCGADEFVP